MSSMYTAVVTLVQDPETLELGGKQATKLRLVAKATSKKAEDRFFNALFFAHDGETAKRLAKGDQIFVAGPLELTSYTSKKTGGKVQSDEMGFGARIMRVLKSPSFFGQAETKGHDNDDAAVDAAAAVFTAGGSPLDGIL